jgi:sodium/potassium-transporting ATPase subunit alpha
MLFFSCRPFSLCCSLSFSCRRCVQGLTAAQYEAALAHYGPNALQPKQRTPWYIHLARSIFTGLFNLLLWAGSALCFLAYGIDQNKDITNLYLGVVLAVVVILTGSFAFYQESSSAAIMEGFKKFLPTVVSCTRDGRALQVKAETLVPGDLIKVGMGGKLPADIRVIEATNDLLANNSSLTGESEPQERGIEADHDVVSRISHRLNMLRCGACSLRLRLARLLSVSVCR